MQKPPVDESAPNLADVGIADVFKFNCDISVGNRLSGVDSVAGRNFHFIWTSIRR